MPSRRQPVPGQFLFEIGVSRVRGSQAAILALVILGGCQTEPKNRSASLSAPDASQRQALSAPADPPQGRPKQTCRPFKNPRSPEPKLSRTGCVDPKRPTQPAPSLIPYEVNSPLWSDGATKKRFLALPDNTHINIVRCQSSACESTSAPSTVEGDFDLPVGTVLVKSFGFEQRLIETRLLIRFDRDTWGGYSYEWNEEQTEAVLLEDSLSGHTKSVSLGENSGRRWYFPSRSECFQCHTQSVGISLGLELAQLDRPLDATPLPREGESLARTRSTGQALAASSSSGPGAPIPENQLAYWAGLGLFDSWPPAKRPTPYPSPADQSASIQHRARSYLHANCAGCHSPKSRFDSLDLRFSTPFAETGLCGKEPRAFAGSLGTKGARLLKPGAPEQSVLSLRMHAATGSYRMPPLATSVVDPLGTELIDRWIRATATCL